MKIKPINNLPENETDHVPDFILELRNNGKGFKVPKGYFASLSPRIVDRINNQKNSSFSTLFKPAFRKRLILVPVMASIIIALILIFSPPSTKNQPLVLVDELTEMNMAYDISYAEEALLAETHIIDNEIESTNADFVSIASINENEPTDDEITDYLKGQEIDPEILNQN